MSKPVKPLFSLTIIVIVVSAISALMLFSLARPVSITVLVEDAITGCANQDNAQYFSCFRQRLSSLVNRFEINQIIGSVRQVLTESPTASDIRVSCHDLSHLVGEVAIHQGADLGSTLVSCTTNCEYGCVHGALIGGISKNPNLLDSPATICQPFSERDFNPQEKDACEHGLGHAFSEYSGMDLQKSLSLCSRLDSIEAKSKCAEGVFMQITDYPSTPFFQINGPVSRFCLSLPSEFTAVCYETASLHEYGRSKDVDKSLFVCDEVPREYYPKCLIALVNLLYSNFQASPQKLLEFCRRQDVHDYHACLLGVIQSDVITDTDASVSLTLCHKQTNINVRNICAQMLGQRYLYVYGRERQTVFCSRLSPDLRNFCMSDEK